MTKTIKLWTVELKIEISICCENPIELVFIFSHLLHHIIIKGSGQVISCVYLSTKWWKWACFCLVEFGSKLLYYILIHEVLKLLVFLLPSLSYTRLFNSPTHTKKMQKIN